MDTRLFERVTAGFHPKVERTNDLSKVNFEILPIF